MAPGMRRDDVADAELVVEVAAALRRWGEASGQRPATKVLRETVWYFWQQPRLPKPLILSKYPRLAPWSLEAARAYLDAGSPDGRLVIEHAEPMNRVLAWLIDGAPTPYEVTEELPRRLAVNVVTKEQSAGLPDAGAPAERYAVAGLDLASFRSLDAWEAELPNDQLAIADLTAGDTRFAFNGARWTAVEVRRNGALIEFDDGRRDEMPWHGLATLGAQETL